MIPLLAGFTLLVAVFSPSGHAHAGTPDPRDPGPFSHVIDWGNETSRKSYEMVLARMGISLQEVPVVQAGGERLAKQEACLRIWQNGVQVGYGAVLRDVHRHGFGSDETTIVEFELKVVEVLYDYEGRYIVLVSYRTLLHPVVQFLFQMWPEKDQYRLEDSRKDIRGRTLDRGYELDNASVQLLQEFTAFPQKCR